MVATRVAPADLLRALQAELRGKRAREVEVAAGSARAAVDDLGQDELVAVRDVELHAARQHRMRDPEGLGAEPLRRTRSSVALSCSPVYGAASAVYQLARTGTGRALRLRAAVRLRPGVRGEARATPAEERDRRRVRDRARAGDPPSPATSSAPKLSRTRPSKSTGSVPSGVRRTRAGRRAGTSAPRRVRVVSARARA